jgi:F0F1-type ATP synthase alpha subunit
MLRRHRDNMRVMDNVITDHGLQEVMEEEMVEVTGNTNFWLSFDNEMDEDSDAEDTERALVEENRELRRTANDQKGFLEAVQGALECRALVTDVERARMQLEDMRGLR